jgi:hypothetical protein
MSCPDPLACALNFSAFALVGIVVLAVLYVCAHGLYLLWRDRVKDDD